MKILIIAGGRINEAFAIDYLHPYQFDKIIAVDGGLAFADKVSKQNSRFKLTDIVGDFINYHLEFTSCPLDKRAIANHTYTTIVNNFPSLAKYYLYIL